MILKFQSADGVCDVLDCVLDRMSEVVHRVDAPLVSRVVVCHMGNTIEDRITHVDVRGCHIDLRTENLLTVLVHTVLHVFE